MGFAPQQFEAMSPWQWAAAFEGYFEAHASAEDKRDILMSDEAFEQAAQMLDN